MAFNHVVVGSSPTVGVHFLFFQPITTPAASVPERWSHSNFEFWWCTSGTEFYKWRKGLKHFLCACNDRGSVAKAHAVMISTGLINHGTFNSQLIALYARIGDIEFARKVFDESSERKINAWNAMIIAYSHKGCAGEVFGLYREMEMEGVRPDSSTFTVALKACTSLMDLERGEEVWKRAIDCGYEFDVFVGASMLNLYAKFGKIEEAMCVFEKMPRKDVVSWTTMVTGFAQCERGREAIDVYRLMKREGVEGDRVVMLGLIQACANVEDMKVGLSVHGYLIRKDIPMDVAVQTSLVDMYAKNGNLDLALRVFGTMQHKTVVSWSALISGYAQNGLSGNALELLKEMQHFGFKPDRTALVSALLACSQDGFLKLGRSLHGYVMRVLDFDQVMGTALIDMYSKCGSLSYARSLFDLIEFKDSISWNAMISCYGMHGHGKEALSLFLQMTETNVKPDHTTFASLLSALSHTGFVEEGRYWFDLMDRKFNIQPGGKHYACMVDLLGRAGRVEEARDLIYSSKLEPEVAVWVSLLSGCLNHGKFLIGEMAAEKILELNPNNMGVYVLVSNFFAAARKWEEVARVRNLMKKMGTQKVPGNSVVEVNGKLYAFLMEDKSHPQYIEILEIMETLEHQMKVMRHEMKTELMFDDNEE